MQDLTLLNKLQYGMYVVTTKNDTICNGQIASVVFQITNDPVQIATCLCKKTYTHELLQKSGVFGVSILEENTPSKFIGTFGYHCGREINKMAGVNFEVLQTGCPLITDNALVIFDVKVKQTFDVGTHTLFVGELCGLQKIKDGVALTYEYYHNVLKGKSPENAPTYIAKK